MKSKVHTIFKGMMVVILGMASAAHAQIRDQNPQDPRGGVPAIHPDSLRVRNIQHAGTGCPAGSVAENVSPDRQAFTLLFDSFVAQTGLGAKPADARKNCALVVDLDYPAGWQFSVVAVDVRGYAALDPGVTGQQVTTGYFQGSRDQFRVQQDFWGPTAEDYLNSAEIPLATATWSPCAQNAARALVLNSQVRLISSNRFANGLMTVDSIDGSVLMTYALRWRRC